MNILFIGDLHIPFEDKGALRFVKKVKRIYDVDKVVFLGDIIDNHATSYHESDPDGLSAGDELEKAKTVLKQWYKEFPNADVCIGNHDSLPNRKAFTSGMSKHWVKNFNEVLNVKNWNFKPYHQYGKWFASHGIGQLVHTRAKEMGLNCVAGHIHSKFEAKYNDGNWSIFAGALVDDDSYAMAYGKWGKKSRKGVVVIKDYDTNNPEVVMIPFDNI